MTLLEWQMVEIRHLLDDRIINFSKTLDSKESVGLKKTKIFLRDYMKIIYLILTKLARFCIPIRKWYERYGKNRLLNELNKDSIQILLKIMHVE